MFPIKIHQGWPVQDVRETEQKNLSKVGLEPSTSNSCGAYSTATSGSARIKTLELFIHLCSKILKYRHSRFRCSGFSRPMPSEKKNFLSWIWSQISEVFRIFQHLRRMTRENRKVSSPWREPSASASAAPKNPKHLSTKRNFKLKLGWNLKRKKTF